MRKQSALCFAMMFAAIAAAAPVDDTYLLRLKVQPDQTVKYQVRNETNMQMMGQDMTQNMSMVMTMATKKAEKGIGVTTTLSDVKLDMGEGNPMAGSVDEMKSAMESMKITAVYDELGKPSDVKVESDNPMATMLAGSLSGGRTGFLGSIYPEKALKLGDTWQVDMDLTKMLNPNADESAKKVPIPVVFTLDKVEGGIATISSVTKGKGTVDSPQGMTLTLNLDMKSTMHIDLATGLLQDATSEGSSDVDMSMGTITQKSKSSIKRL